MAKPETDVHVLRTVPPREFVHARDALVERLTKAGKTAEARQIRRLRRPSPVVWAVNRVAERHAQDLAALIDAVDRLRRAQLGQGEVRRTTDDYRQAFQRVVNRAGEVLREADTRVTPDLERRIRSTLQAAVADRQLRRDLQAGHLAEEHTDPGFAVLTQGPIPAEFLSSPSKSRSRTAESRQRGRRQEQAPDAERAAGPVPGRPAPSPRHEQKEQKAETRRQAQQARDAREAALRAVRAAKTLERDARRQALLAAAAARRVEATRKVLQEQERTSAQLRERAEEAKRRYEQARGRPGSQ
jgi:hypothetical protein